MFLKLREILSIEMNLPAFSLHYEDAGFTPGIPGISPEYILPLHRAGTAGLVRAGLLPWLF